MRVITGLYLRIFAAPAGYLMAGLEFTDSYDAPEATARMILPNSCYISDRSVRCAAKSEISPCDAHKGHFYCVKGHMLRKADFHTVSAFCASMLCV